MPTRPSRPALVVAAGAVLLVVGLALVVLTRDEVVTFGWFDYAPLEAGTLATPPRSVLVLSPARTWGLALAAAGALAVSAALGYTAGRRSATAAPPEQR